MNNFDLDIVLADEMNQANDELRDTIRSIWPLQAKKMLDLLIPRNEGKLIFLGGGRGKDIEGIL